MISWFFYYFVVFIWFFVARARARSRFAVYHDPPGGPRWSVVERRGPESDVEGCLLLLRGCA